MASLTDLLKRLWDNGGREAAVAAGMDLLSQQAVPVQMGIGRAVAAMHLPTCACGESSVGGCMACGMAFCGQHGLVQLGPALGYQPAGMVLPGLCGACGNKAYEALRGGARKAVDNAWNGVRRAAAREEREDGGAPDPMPPPPPPHAPRRGPGPADMPPPYDPGVPPPPPGASRRYEPPRGSTHPSDAFTPLEVVGAYKALGLKHGASMDTVRRRQKKLAARWHPDVRGGSLERMQEINRAVDILDRWHAQRKAA